MSNRRIPINRENGVVIGYHVTENRWEYYQSERGEWWTSGGGGSAFFTDQKKAFAAFRKALKRHSGSASISTVVIPERLPA